MLALRDGDELRYAGMVGTGFSEAKRRELAETLECDRIAKTTERNAPRVRIARWVKPRLVAEVSFSEWTRVRRE